MVEPGGVQLGTAGQEPTTPGTLHVAGDRFCLSPDEWIEQPQQVTIKRNSGHLSFDLGNRLGVVADYRPRFLWGMKHGRPFTVIDAQMSVEVGAKFLPVQLYEARSILWDAHVEGPDIVATAVRVTFSLRRPAWVNEEPVSLEEGRLSSWSAKNRPGLTWEPSGAHTLHELTQRVSSVMVALLDLWTGGTVGAHSVQVRLTDGRWCKLESAQEPPPTRDQSFLSLNKLTLGVVASWLKMAQNLGPLPFMAVGGGAPLQADAQMLATALEGLHRRLHPDAKRFRMPVSRADLRRARRQASKAAVVALDGIVDADMVKKVYDEALGHVDEPSYADRLAEILPDVVPVAPGLLGPSLSGWIKDMKDLRNIQSHGLQNHDNFGEAEISRYYVMAASGRWALKILLLLELVDEDQVGTALHDSDRFMFALANIDREGYWAGFSAYEEFAAHPGTSKADT